MLASGRTLRPSDPLLQSVSMARARAHQWLAVDAQEEAVEKDQEGVGGMNLLRRQQVQVLHAQVYALHTIQRTQGPPC